MTCYYDLDPFETTDYRLLSSVTNDYSYTNYKLSKNCRNISDEVFPGVHVGDK